MQLSVHKFVKILCMVLDNGSVHKFVKMHGLS